MPADDEVGTSFIPRPEAHTMTWGELMPPQRRAVAELLWKLDGAAGRVPACAFEDTLRRGPERANCFLIWGERGTGKTTVLLSAREAVQKDSRYFQDARDADDEEGLRIAKESAAVLRSKEALWLDILDLELLHPKANLLTILLTRLLNALDSPDGEPPRATRSIWEDGADSARQLLRHLIADASLMWGEIEETSTRDRANREISAAEINARFRKDFLNAMKTLARDLGHTHGRTDECQPIILPIDNIDRSTEHLASIMKLAQMIICPNLWLVMAGDRQDVDLFLERAYWKELITLQETGGTATGKTGVSGEDEAFAMARRQAASTTHRLLPPSHRIRVRLMKPDETLAFPYRGKTIADLLKMIRMDSDRHPSVCPLTNMLQFFRFDADSLTPMARIALRLPARAVVDLWQMAAWIASKGRRFQEPYEKLARLMLTNRIDQTRISSEMGQFLKERIIRRTAGDETVLDFTHPNPTLDIDPMLAPDWVLNKTAGDESHTISSTLTIHKSARRVLSLGDLPDRELPELVAGWLMLLYDCVVWSGSGNLRYTRPLETSLITVEHKVASLHKTAHYPYCLAGSPQFCWPAPDWETFYMHSLLELHWQKVLGLSHESQNGNRTCEQTIRLLAAGWIYAVVSAFYFRMSLKKESEEFKVACESKQLTSRNANPDAVEQGIREFEIGAWRYAGQLYSTLSPEALTNGATRTVACFNGTARWKMQVREWLERKLPLMLSYMYVPKEDIATEESMASDKAVQPLVAAWRVNANLILAEHDMEMARMLCPCRNEYWTQENATKHPGDVAPSCLPMIKEWIPKNFDRLAKFLRPDHGA